MTTYNLKKCSFGRSDPQAQWKRITCARAPVGCLSGASQIYPQCTAFWPHFPLEFPYTSTALKPTYQLFRLLKFEIPEMMEGLCCCAHECCYNHGIMPGLGPDVKGSGSSLMPLGMIQENKEWQSSSAFLSLHWAWSVISRACYTRSCIWALSQREMHN